MRDGDAEALHGLVARRGPAVLAYCMAVCEPAAARAATAEAFARFRAAVVAADDPAHLQPEVLLLGATRHAAAAVARTAASHGGLRASLRRDHGHSEICAQVPMLLAARSEELLGPGELALLSEHLDRHMACRTIAEDVAGAERAYGNPPRRPLDDDLTEAIVAALVAAAPVTGAPVSDELDEFEPLPDTAPAPPDELADVEAFEPPPDEPASAAPEGREPPVPAEPEPPAPEPEAAQARSTITPAPEAETAPEPSPREAFAAPGGEPATELAAATGGDRREPPAAELAAARSTGLPRTRRHVHLPHPHFAAHSPAYRLILPASTIVVALIIILAIAGVFGGDGPSPAVVHAG